MDMRPFSGSVKTTPQFWRQLENRSYYPRLDIDGDKKGLALATVALSASAALRS